MLKTRMLSQGLATGSGFEEPGKVVEWMGAMQAQDIRAAKWAVGLRMLEPSQEAVREALDTGRILRIHVMRPTWHYIPARDIKWMSAMCIKSLMSGWLSYGRPLGVTEQDYRRNKPVLEKILDGQHLTLTEILEQFQLKGINIHENIVKMLTFFAEAEGIICNGVEKSGKHTFALTCQRVPDAVDLNREEAVAEIARRYFRSHGPATLEDFVWWSGLGIREARGGIASLGKEILTERYNDREMMIHISSPGLSPEARTDDTSMVRFLPPFDEYLVSYKNRFDCIKEAHTRYAYNNFGIFQPVILHNGRITGNWRKTSKKGIINTTFFPGCRPAAKKLIDKAGKEYVSFHDR